MSTFKKVIEGTGYISAGQALDMGMGLLVTFLLVRLLSVPDYGVYVLVLSVATFFASLSDLSTSTLMVSKLPGARTDSLRAGLLRGYRSFVLVIAIAASLALAASAEPIAAALGVPAAAIAFRIAALAALFQSFLTAIQAVLVAFTRFKQTFKVTASLEISRLALVAALVPSLGLTGAVLAYSFSFLIAVLTGFPALRSVLRPLRAPPEPGFAALMKREGKFAVGSHFLKQLRANAILWIIAVLVGPAYVAYYAIGMSVLSAFTVPLSALEQTLYPLLSGALLRGRRAASLLFAKAVKYGFLLSLLPAGLLVLLVGPLVELVFTKHYVFSLFFYRILALEVLLTGITVAFRPLLFALSKQKDIFLANTVSVLSLLVLAILLAPLEPRLLTTAYVLSSLAAVLSYVAVLRAARVRFSLSALFASDRIDREIQARLGAKLRQLLRRKRAAGPQGGAHRP